MERFCHCGRLLKEWTFGNSVIVRCKVHGMNPKPPAERKKIGKYSGTSRKIKGAYEQD